MKRSATCQVLVCLLTILSAISVTRDSAYAITLEDHGTLPRDTQLEAAELYLTGKISTPPTPYAPDQIIVKFTDSVVASNTIQAFLDGKPRSSLDQTIKREKVVAISPLIAGLHDEMGKPRISGYAKLESLKASFPLRAGRASGDLLSALDLENIYLFKLASGQSIPAVLNNLTKAPGIKYALPDHILSFTRNELIPPNDPFYPSRGTWGQDYLDLYGVHRLNSLEAWSSSQGQGVVIAMIDSGVDYNHPDIFSNIWVDPSIVQDENNDQRIDLQDLDRNHNRAIETDEIQLGAIGWDFGDSDGDPNDFIGHGTHCAGTAAAAGNNAIGIVGVAPRAKVMPIKISRDSDNRLLASAAVSGIFYAVDRGADVLSMSWGGINENQAITEAIDFASAAGAIPVVAAGNGNIDVRFAHPASHDRVISVAALDPYGDKAFFSNFGDRIDVAAPGMDILSLRAEHAIIGIPVAERYSRLSGTSMACPHVSGLAALIISRFPQLSFQQILGRIHHGARPFPSPQTVPLGAGIANSSYALGERDRPFAAVRNARRTTSRPLIPGRPWGLELDVISANLPSPFPGTLSTRNNVEMSVLLQSMFQRPPSAWFATNHDDPFSLVYHGSLPRFSGDLPLTLSVGSSHHSFSLYIPSSGQPSGWPVIPGDEVFGTASSPVVADIDLDGMPEVILNVVDYALQTRIYVWNSNGTTRHGWPRFIPGRVGQISVADLDGKGSKEIVVPAFDEHAIFVFNPDGTDTVGFPAYLQGSRLVERIAIGNIAGDRSLEIVVPSSIPLGVCPPACRDTFRIDVIQADGSPLPGWPHTFGDGAGAGTSSWPQLGDFDGDGLKEIVVFHALSASSDHTILDVLRYDRTAPEGWPLNLGFFYIQGAPALEEDENGQIRRIYAGGIIYTGEGTNQHSEIRVFDAAGNSVTGWPRAVGPITPVGQPLSPLTLADLNGDGAFELMGAAQMVDAVSRENNLYVWQENGELLPGWPISIATSGSSIDGRQSGVIEPMAGDIDGDGDLEIVIGMSDGVYAYHHDGSAMSGFPLRTPSPVYPVLSDMNGDSQMEIVGSVLVGGTVNAWTMPYGTFDTRPWPQFHANAERTGQLIRHE